MLLSIDLENHICELEYLKNLQIGGYGLVSLPEDFDRLGNSLESLDLSAQLHRCTRCIDSKQLPKTEKSDI